MFRRWWWIFLIMAVVGPLLGFLAAVVVTYVMPKKYESIAVVQVAYGSGQRAGEGDSEPPLPPSPQFMGTEMEVIRAEKTLGMAADRLELPMRWGVDRREAVAIMRKIVETQAIRATELIEIRVRDTNAEDARDVAMEVAKAYRDRHAEFARERGEKALEVLGKIRREQEDRVMAKKMELDRILKADGMNAGGEKDPVESRRHLDAKEGLEEEQRRLDEIEQDYRSRRIGLELPLSSGVIHEEPVLARVPCSPNVTLNLILGLVAGFFLGLLLGFPLMWMAGRMAGRG